MRYLDSFLSLLRGETPEHIVWTADLEYWISGREVDGTAKEEWRTEEGFLKLCAELEIMPYYCYHSGFWLGEPEYDDTVRVETARSGNITTTSWTTPLGTMTSETKFMRESCSEAHTRFPVTDKKSLDIFRYMIEHRKLKPALLDTYPERLELWRKYDGLPSIAMPRSPLAAFFYEWAGVMHGVYLLMDYSEEIKDLFGMMAEQEDPVIDAVCKTQPPLVHFADNMSSDNMAGYYDSYMKDVHTNRLTHFHSAGIKCVVHLDGVVRGLLPKLAQVGMDGIEALTPEPGGDMPVEEMREVARNDAVILWGGLPGVLFAPPYTWEDMKKHLEKVLDSWKGSPFVLGVADQIPPDGDITLCNRVAEVIRDKEKMYG